MKRLVCILALIVLAIPAWTAAKKITVGQLEDMLKTLQAEKKSDADIANALKQVEMSEELTRDALNNIAQSSPGQFTLEQLYVLEARSSVLAPPAEDIPTTPALDAAAQKALLDKAAEYATKSYAQLPELDATKTTLRFQDNIEATAASSGLGQNAAGVEVGSSFTDPYQFIHYINSTESPYVSEHGVEQLAKDKTQWGRNAMIALEDPSPGLGEVFQDAEAAGGIKWLRWEIINGKPAAVFSYTTEKKNTRLSVNVCCFPTVNEAGIANFTSSSVGSAGAPSSSAGAGGATGNFQTTTDWHNFKASGIPYHGEIFIDPDTGIVVRMIAEAEFKPADVVHQDDTRVDYGPVTIGDKTVVLPMRTIVLTDVAPNGEGNAAGTYTKRRTFFTTEYKNYTAKNPALLVTTPGLIRTTTTTTIRRVEPSINQKNAENVNAELTEARKATSEKRYADSEALLLKVTAANPKLMLPWVELGLAQLALNKYPDAEKDFVTALGIDPGQIRQEHVANFYDTNSKPGSIASGATRSNALGGSGEVVSTTNNASDVRGSSYASLGEIYAHEGKIDQAKDAFDKAVSLNPPQAEQYRHNETVVFFDTGHADEQLVAADQAIALDSTRAANYYFKAQALATKATVDPKTQKMVLPPGCLEAYQKYLQLDPKGAYSADAKSIVAAASK
jgi:tetratricopeptide (TPR) repeat protein